MRLSPVRVSVESLELPDVEPDVDTPGGSEEPLVEVVVEVGVSLASPITSGCCPNTRAK
jgi:hypothetical protein